MEVQEYKHDPESNFECLVQQVEEQSEFCDVTVTMGDWRKRFHRCVLTASLLFRSIIETQIADSKIGNYDGKTDRIQDTEIEIKINMSPDIVEMAVMFMYGKIPEFTIANIGDLLELAEYLKIKELKDACVDWFD
ncbi:uncharacterized protein LOC132746672, partial [Ruditapes philippinarum]|uniref:uncharacterized protein LOC132746672 n=1 Tax=Ruditapes philippinarum TaxID=129788 RepID=UPI00295C1D76